MSETQRLLKTIKRLSDRGEYDRAIVLAHELVAKYPLDDMVLQARASLYQSRGLFESAAADLGLAIELNPSEPNHFFMSAFIHLRLGNWKRVVAECTSGLGLGHHAHSSCFFFFRAEALIALGRKAEARADLLNIDEPGRIWTNQLRSKEDLLSLCE